MKPQCKILLVIALAALLTLPFHADDKELFMGLEVSQNVVKPNVVFLADTSGSMNTLIHYPKNGVDGIAGTADDGFDPRISYTGSVERGSEFSDSGSYWVASNQSTQWFARWQHNGNAYIYDTGDLGGNWTGCYGSDGSPDHFQVGSNAVNFVEGETIMFRDTSSPYYYALATLASKYTDGGNNWFELSDIVGGPITVNGGHFQRYPGRTPVIVRLYSEYDSGNYTRLDEEYLKWVFIHATDEIRTAVSHHSVYGTFDVNDTSLLGATSVCDTGGGSRAMKRFTRIQVTREVLCHVARNSNLNVRMGLFSFDGSGSDYGNGGKKVEDLGDKSDASALSTYLDHVWDIEGDSNTPVAEALADVWDYLKPHPEGDDDPNEFWPTDVMIDNGTISAEDSESPIQWWCQNNYVVVMTDGESTQDNFSNSKFDGSIFRSRPVKRSEPWSDWYDGWGDLDNNDQYYGRPSSYNPDTATYCPQWTCWLGGSSGTDYLDDVAYFLRHQDLFPDEDFGEDTVSGWPGEQSVYTYVIGFNQDNDMLRETAINGDGVYYTANNYDELVASFESVITSILLRNFAFSAITAPKKTASIATEGVSYVGYFMPSQAAPIWEGHLLSHRLFERWGFDSDDSGTIDYSEMFDTVEECETANPGEECTRILELAAAAEWDAATMLANRTSGRSIYTELDGTVTAFTEANKATIQPYMGTGVDETETGQIINRLNEKYFADVFHSDIAFVGPPLLGKKYIPNINPIECTDPTSDTDCYEYFQNNNSSRGRVLYVGTNDGIMHMLDAESGDELWGFIPEDILPSLAHIVLGGAHTYTVDGRVYADDIFYRKDAVRGWKSIVVYGLRRGGRSFHALDVTSVGSQPVPLWSFSDATYSGQSFAKPIVGQVQIKEGTDVVKKWVVFLAGGFEFNEENTADPRGKAVFMVDASTGELLWMTGFNQDDGAEDSVATTYIDTDTDDDIHYLTKAPVFNYAIPSALTVVDTDSNGLLDTMYFGNTGGHLFRTDISPSETDNWHTTLVYQTNVQTLASGVIDEITGGNELDVGTDASDFEAGWTVRGTTSNATGYIKEIDGEVLTMDVTSGTFQVDETVVARSWDPIHLQPAVAYDPCYQLWVTFGTGDRDRPRTNPNKGRFIGIRDAALSGQTLSDLLELTWVDDELSATSVDQASYNGWYFDFLDGGEKLFDPEPIVLPGEGLGPIIYFNTYQPSPEVELGPQENPCAAPSEGNMMLYAVSITACAPDIVVGGRESGRLAGGGIHQGQEYVQYIGVGEVGSVPPLDQVIGKKLPYPGGVIFWKEKKR